MPLTSRAVYEDSRDLNQEFAVATRKLLALGFGVWASVEIGRHTLTLRPEGLSVSSAGVRIPLERCSRKVRCEAALALPRLLDAMVKMGESESAAIHRALDAEGER